MRDVLDQVDIFVTTTGNKDIIMVRRSARQPAALWPSKLRLSETVKDAAAAVRDSTVDKGSCRATHCDRSHGLSLGTLLQCSRRTCRR
jgi:hypothetical protein